MSMRIRAARFLLNIGIFLESLPVVVMKPDELVEFSRQNYSRPQVIESWSNEAHINSGLYENELDLLQDIGVKSGNLLILGVGGGREAIPLARMGFRVTGVDYVTKMVDRAIENAARAGISIEGQVQDISKLDVPANAFDVVWLSCVAYSCVPTRKRRIEMVQRIRKALKPGGYFLCQFHLEQGRNSSGRDEAARCWIAKSWLGNRTYEPGDILWARAEYLHTFASVDEVRSELEAGGFNVERFETKINPVRCGAVCSDHCRTQ